MTTTTKPKSGFFIGVGCPGCGGDIDLDADFFVLGCDHCGSPLRVIMPAIPPAFMAPGKMADHEIRFCLDRHLKKNNLPLINSTLHIKRLYYPYWKADATILKLRNKTEVKKICSENDSSVESVIETDRSTVSISPYSITIAAGTAMDGLPASIGMRSETVRVIPFAKENIDDNFDALPVLIPWEVVIKKVQAAVKALSAINPADFGQNITRMFNPSFSLIYFPFFVIEAYGADYRRFVIDGMVGRVLKVITPGQSEPESIDSMSVSSSGSKTVSAAADMHDNFAADDLARGLAQNVATNDPELGVDYDHPPEISFGQLDVGFHRCRNCGSDLPTEMSYIYICDNCHEVQTLGQDGLPVPRVEFVDGITDPATKMVPFWRLGLPELMAKRFGNLLGGLDKREQMFVPAIGSNNFEAVHRLAKRMSAAQGKLPTEVVESLDDRFLPVRVGQAEALALAEMIVCRELVDRGHKVPEEGIAINPQSVTLVFVPFHLENYFYVDSVLNAVTLERTLLD